MQKKEIDGIIVLEFKGRVVQETCDEIEETIGELYKTRKGAKIVIDFSQVSHVCSAALGILVFSKKRLKKDGGDIKLVVTSTELMNLFETTLLTKVFDLYTIQEEAIHHFLNEKN